MSREVDSENGTGPPMQGFSEIKPSDKLFKVNDLHMHEVWLDGRPENKTNYNELGARPKLKLESKLHSSSSSLVVSAVRKASPSKVVIDNGCTKHPKGYVKKLGDWFDGQSEYSATPIEVPNDENMTKCDFIEVSEAEILPTITPRFDEKVTLPKRHLPMGNLNTKICEFSLNQDDRKNDSKQDSLTPISLNTPKIDLKVRGDAEGVISQSIDPGKRGEGGTVTTPLKPPRRISTKILPSKKPQTPEYKRILRRIKDKKLARAKNDRNCDQKCDSEMLGGSDQVKVETAEIQKKSENDMALKMKTLKNMFECPEKVKKSEGGPQSAVKTHKKRGQIGRKIRGKKMDSIEDPKQPKLDTFWLKKKNDG